MYRACLGCRGIAREEDLEAGARMGEWGGGERSGHVRPC